MNYLHKLIKFSQKRPRNFTPQTAQCSGHTAEIRGTQCSVSVLQQRKQGLPVVFCIPGVNREWYQVCFSVFFFFTVGEIKAKFCHRVLTSHRHVGSPPLGDPAQKQSYWILGGNCATCSAMPFRKNSSKQNYVMAISSFKPSEGQVGAGPRSEQSPLWVLGWGKDRSAQLQEIRGSAGAPLNMSAVGLHHRTCQNPPLKQNDAIFCASSTKVPSNPCLG